MKTATQRYDPIRLFGKRVLLVILALLVVVGISSVWKTYQKERTSAILNEQTQAELADLRERNAQLEARVASLKTEHGKEATLRQQYQVGKPGEELIVIIDPKNAAQAATQTTGFRAWMHKTLNW
jgi:cell division protein FtsB